MNSAQAVTVLHRLRKLVVAPEAALVEAASDAQLLLRFTDGQDHTAFAGLVARHGPMVLGVCRSVLHNWHDAEDAFQATFLVLAKKATSIRNAGSIACWLYGVAYHAAVKAQARAARRRARERKAAEMSSTDPLLDMTLREVQQVLHEELQQLPEKYRLPLVLCYLEGKSQEEAASQLGWSRGATRGRLDRGREQLRKRLAGRGVALSAVLGAGSLGALASPVSAALADSVVGAVLPSASGGQAASALSANASALAEGVIRAMFASKMKTATAILFAATLLVAGTSWILHATLSAQEAKPSTTATSTADRAKGPEKTDKRSETFAGRVLDPDGKPVAGARVYISRSRYEKKQHQGTPKARAVTGEAGRFRFSVPGAEPDGRNTTVVFAIADGFGLGWVTRPTKTADLTLRLAKDDVPVTGRILNLEGKPVAGVSLQVTAVKAPRGDSLTPWLDAVKTRTTSDGYSLEYELLPMFSTIDLHRLFPAITTSADGRFTLRGIGRERAVTLLVEGPTIETREINVLTRPGVPAITIPGYRHAPELGELTYYATGFDHAAAPCRPVSGVVRYRGTGKPVAGAIVRSERGVGNPVRNIQTTTDQAGRYRLTGLPAGPGRRGLDTLVVVPPENQAYVSAQKRIEGKDRIQPVTLDFDLPRGVWIEGRVTDKGTGEGVQASLRYFVFRSQQTEVDLRSVHLENWLQTDKQGRFRFVGAPCRAILGARASLTLREQFRIGVGADKIKGGENLIRNVKGVRGLMFDTLPYYAVAWDYDTLAEIKPPKDADKVTCDLVLDPGQTQRVRVLDPDGKPLAGVRVAGMFAREFFHHEPTRGAEFTVHGMTPGEPRQLMFQHEGRKLSGVLEVKAASQKVVEVKLQPSAAVSGRLIRDDGKPMGHAEIKVYYYHEDERNYLHNHHPRDILTDAEGRFRLAGLVPGIRYVAHVPLRGKMYPGEVFHNLSLKAGESKALGDVKPMTKDE
jgi:RNA polymerase sigma factor (sigma-70 family)